MDDDPCRGDRAELAVQQPALGRCAQHPPQAGVPALFAGGAVVRCAQRGVEDPEGAASEAAGASSEAEKASRMTARRGLIAPPIGRPAKYWRGLVAGGRMFGSQAAGGAGGAT